VNAPSVLSRSQPPADGAIVAWQRQVDSPFDDGAAMMGSECFDHLKVTRGYKERMVATCTASATGLCSTSA
jgi:hypothetical protein